MLAYERGTGGFLKEVFWSRVSQGASGVLGGWSGMFYLRIARETFCFHGLSFLIPIPNPERKKSSPVVTRSHFCEASNSNTALSQMKAWSLL